MRGFQDMGETAAKNSQTTGKSHNWPLMVWRKYCRDICCWTEFLLYLYLAYKSRLRVVTKRRKRCPKVKKVDLSMAARSIKMNWADRHGVYCIRWPLHIPINRLPDNQRTWCPFSASYHDRIHVIFALKTSLSSMWALFCKIRCYEIMMMTQRCLLFGNNKYFILICD